MGKWSFHLIDRECLSWYLYLMVTQNMLRTCVIKIWAFMRKNFILALDLNKCLKQSQLPNIYKNVRTFFWGTFGWCSFSLLENILLTENDFSPGFQVFLAQAGFARIFSNSIHKYPYHRYIREKILYGAKYCQIVYISILTIDI